jgi:hypothetical protein
MGTTWPQGRITAKTANRMLEVLDEVREDLLGEEKAHYPYAEWERRRAKIRDRLRGLPERVHRAADIRVDRRAGRPPALSLEQRTLLLLFTRMMNRSQRTSRTSSASSGPSSASR